MRRRSMATSTRRAALRAAVALGTLCASAAAGPAMAQAVTEYSVPGIADFSGPFADLSKQMVPARDAVIRWWNDTEGKKLGVKLNVKNFVTRYDGTVVASMWPGILTDMKPVIAM